MERLQKVIAAAGLASRRQAEDFVRAGRVYVNGQIVRKVGVKVDPERDEIRVNGYRIDPQVSRVYIVLNKPAGILTTRRDPQGRPTVLDLLGAHGPSVYPVGRLDKLSMGLLLLTNDGEVTKVLTHPRYQVPKVYHVWTQTPVLPEEREQLRKGVRLNDGMARAVKVRPLGKQQRGLELVLTEGRKHEVRRMLAALGHSVRNLVRTELGPLKLGTLGPGQWRYLEPPEIAQLREFIKERQAVTVRSQDKSTPGPPSATPPAPRVQT